VVVVDAFRASTTIAVLVSKGARVVPVASVEEAASARTDFRIGERGSAKVAGFDFGNSPTEIMGSEIPPGSKIACSTTNGTRVVEAARGARTILTGAFVNAGILAEELAGGVPRQRRGGGSRVRLGGSPRFRRRGCGGSYPPPAAVSWC
jgi:2-phosphosulfolactate phosphatase